MSKLSEDADYEYYPGYKVPKHYTVPPNYGFSESTAPSSSSTTEQRVTETETRNQASNASIEAALAAGMLGLFGGIAIGRVSKRKKKF